MRHYRSLQRIALTGFCPNEGDRWVANAAVNAMGNERVMHDDGKNGDAAANDGIYTCAAFSLQSDERKLAPGRYLLRVVVHDEDNVAAVDVDGLGVN